MHQVAVAALLAVTVVGALPAEAVGPAEIDARRHRVNATAMITLGSWALLNIGSGSILTFQTEGSLRYFHEMNALWNTVNLGIAGLGLAGSLRAVPGQDLYESIDAQYGLEKALLFNAGLDIAYIMTGLYLAQLSRSAGDQNERLQGYGESLILQGGFLLGFDLVVYLAQRRGRRLIREALALR